MEIKFDPAARHDFLTGFSKRKKERRVFGLAMGKLKARKDALDERKEIRAAKKEEVREKEENMRLNRKQKDGDNGDDDDADDDNDDDNDDSNADAGRDVTDLIRSSIPSSFPLDASAPPASSSASLPSGKISVIPFTNDSTISMFGAGVTVSVSYGLSGAGVCGNDSDDDDSELLHSRQRGEKKVDVDQRYAGNVTKFMKDVSASLGNKKKTDRKGWTGKGMHGAQGMKGAGGAATVKLAKKLIGRYSDGEAQAKSAKHMAKGKKGKGRQAGGKGQKR